MRTNMSGWEADGARNLFGTERADATQRHEAPTRGEAILEIDPTKRTVRGAVARGAMSAIRIGQSVAGRDLAPLEGKKEEVHGGENALQQWVEKTMQKGREAVQSIEVDGQSSAGT